MSTIKHQPDGYTTISVYLVLNDIQSVLDFVINAFKGEVIEKIELTDGRIMHAEVRVGDSVIMMGPSRQENNATTSMLYIYVEDTDHTYQDCLNAGATSEMEPADQFYGDRNAGVKSPGGNLFWIATHFEDVSQEDLTKRAQEMAKQFEEG